MGGSTKDDCVARTGDTLIVEGNGNTEGIHKKKLVPMGDAEIEAVTLVDGGGDASEDACVVSDGAACSLGSMTCFSGENAAGDSDTS